VTTMAKHEKAAHNYNKPEEVKEPDPAVTALVMSLASYVSGNDIGKDREEFLRSVAGRILEDLGM
jgi:hypothetical protein